MILKTLVSLDRGLGFWFGVALELISDAVTAECGCTYLTEASLLLREHIISLFTIFWLV